jgi:hypothetical protein
MTSVIAAVLVLVTADRARHVIAARDSPGPHEPPGRSDR